MINYYKVLGAKTDASPAELSQRFQSKVRLASFFAFGAGRVKQLEKIKEAFDCLIDPALRYKHDVQSKLYLEGEPAPWRMAYAKYSNEDLKKDLAISRNLFEQIVERMEKPNWIPKIIVTLIVVDLLAIAGYVAYVLLIEEKVEKTVKAVPVIKHEQKNISYPTVEILSYGESQLLTQLTPSLQKEVRSSIRQVEQLRQDPAFGKLMQGCSIHLEPVTVAEELPIKFQGLLNCLRELAQ